MKKKVIVVFLILLILPIQDAFAFKLRHQLEGEQIRQINEMIVVLRGMENSMDKLPEEMRKSITHTRKELEVLMSSVKGVLHEVITEGGHQLKLVATHTGREAIKVVNAAGDEMTDLTNQISGEVEKNVINFMKQSERLTSHVTRELSGLINQFHTNNEKTVHIIGDLMDAKMENGEAALTRLFKYMNDETLKTANDILQQMGVEAEALVRLGSDLAGENSKAFFASLQEYTVDSEQLIDRMLEARLQQATDELNRNLTTVSRDMHQLLSKFDSMLAGHLREAERIGLVFIKELQDVVHEETEFVFENLFELESVMKRDIDDSADHFFDRFHGLLSDGTNLLVKGVCGILVVFLFFGIVLRSVKYDKGITKRQLPYILAFTLAVSILIIVDSPVRSNYNFNRTLSEADNKYTEITSLSKISSLSLLEIPNHIDFLQTYHDSIRPCSPNALTKRNEIRLQIRKMYKFL